MVERKLKGKSTFTYFFAEHIKQDLALYYQSSFVPFPKYQAERYDYFSLGQIIKGSMLISLNGCTHRILEGEMYCVFPDQELQLLEQSEDLSLNYIVLTHGLVNHIIYKYPQFIFYYLEKHPSFRIHPKYKRNIELFVKLFFLKYNAPEHPFLKDSMLELLQAFGLDVMEVFYKAYASLDMELSSQEKIVEEFQFQFFQHLYEQKNLSFYAKKIGITTTHLNRVMKASKGIGAKQYMIRMLIIEMKQLLVYTSMTIKEISMHFGFTSPDAFHHFFKQNVERSPIDFRKNNSVQRKLSHASRQQEQPILEEVLKLEFAF